MFDRENNRKKLEAQRRHLERVHYQEQNRHFLFAVERYSHLMNRAPAFLQKVDETVAPVALDENAFIKAKQESHLAMGYSEEQALEIAHQHGHRIGEYNPITHQVTVKLLPPYIATSEEADKRHYLLVYGHEKGHDLVPQYHDVDITIAARALGLTVEKTRELILTVAECNPYLFMKYLDAKSITLQPLLTLRKQQAPAVSFEGWLRKVLSHDIDVIFTALDDDEVTVEDYRQFVADTPLKLSIIDRSVQIEGEGIAPVQAARSHLEIAKEILAGTYDVRVVARSR